MNLEEKKVFLKKNKKIKEFFIADDVKISSFRNEIMSMEHPIFSLKGGDTRIRIYEYGNVIIKIKPTADGIANIFDKDIWIYSISKLQSEINKNNSKISKAICFTPYDFFISTKRNKSGRSYEELRKALSRLKGTIIETNIFYSKNKKKSLSFGLIDSWKILEEKKGKLNIGMIEIILPEWLYVALKNKRILKISEDYFKIRKSIDRRIYEIARKHCGNQKFFKISTKKLYLKTGSTSLLKMFKHNLKRLVRKNNLPDYNIRYNLYKDIITFSKRF
uniref:Putative replication protein n=1 Tax=Wigglesworthia glossinidia brevipalpis TaxID=36870 RepID=REPX_WIGBR|nr:RecName: Full=Putative replication protein [Wigglesworthia glossinidia endosymbiont of Glossina brevipalpis]